MDVTKTSEKLASFNAVENTYLSVFMLLGGLGVIMGISGSAWSFSGICWNGKMSSHYTLQSDLHITLS